MRIKDSINQKTENSQWKLSNRGKLRCVHIFLQTLKALTSQPFSSLSYGHRTTTPERFRRQPTITGQCLRRTATGRGGGWHHCGGTSSGEEVARVARGLRIPSHRASGEGWEHHRAQGRTDKEDVWRDTISHSRSWRSPRHSWSNCKSQLHLIAPSV